MVFARLNFLTFLLAHYTKHKFSTISKPLVGPSYSDFGKRPTPFHVGSHVNTAERVVDGYTENSQIAPRPGREEKMFGFLKQAAAFSHQVTISLTKKCFLEDG